MACLAASAGLGCGYLAVVTGFERAAFCVVMRGYAKPPFFLSGKGSAGDPWELRTLAAKAQIDSRQAPVVVSIGDDPDGVFQSSPPSPVDLAVVLQNLQRLGAKQAAIAAVMAWEKPDPASLKGLEMVLDDFQMVIHAAPLSRGTVRQAMPPALRRASLAPEAIQGDRSRLPIVNRVAVPDVIFGGERSLAGFASVDDVDSGSGSLQLLVRWEEEDRVLLAFPLLAVLAHYDLPVAGIQVKLGEFLQLGPAGPVVPIDQNGRMTLPPKQVASRADVSAEALIVGTPEIFPAEPGLIVLRDDQSSAPRATRQFSATLTSAIASIGSDAGLGSACSYRRLAPAWEAGLLLGVVVLLAMIAAGSRFQRLLSCGVLAAACVAAQWLVLGVARVWLPGIPLLAAILAGALVMFLAGRAVPAARQAEAFPAPIAPQAQVPRAVIPTSRTFRSVTVWREPHTRPAATGMTPLADDLPPLVVAEVPAAVPEEPAAVPEEPAAVPEEPAAVPEEPAPVPVEPTAVLEEPTAVLEEPAAVLEEPAAVLEEPAPVPVEAAPVVVEVELAQAQPVAPVRKGTAKKPPPASTGDKRGSKKSSGKPSAVRKSKVKKR